MKWLEISSPTKKTFLKVSQISMVEICGKTNSLVIICADKSHAGLKADKNPKIIKQLKKLGLLSKKFKVSDLKH